MKDTASATRGRPPRGYHRVGGELVHKSTGQLFDPDAHAEFLRAMKRIRMKKKYWERGGREKRLSRYTRKRPPPLVTLDAFAKG